MVLKTAWYFNNNVVNTSQLSLDVIIVKLPSEVLKCEIKNKKKNKRHVEKFQVVRYLDP